jgi:hypothetical protein
MRLVWPRLANRAIVYAMRRRLWQALVLCLAVLAMASVSINCGRTFVVSDTQGAPVHGAYVAYHHEGTTYAVVEALTYQASRQALLQSDVNGRVVIPWAVHVHLPLVQSHPVVNIDLIYAPTLHNGLAWVSRLGAVSRPLEFEVSADLANVRLADVSGDPFLWQGTLMNLSSLLSRLSSRPTAGEATPRLIRELAERFKGEYAAILDRYGDVLRPVPEMPVAVRGSTEQEQRAWRAMVENDPAQRPRWGDELKRRFATEIEIYSRGKGRR